MVQIITWLIVMGVIVGAVVLGKRGFRPKISLWLSGLGGIFFAAWFNIQFEHRYAWTNVVGQSTYTAGGFNGFCQHVINNGFNGSTVNPVQTSSLCEQAANYESTKATAFWLAVVLFGTAWGLYRRHSRRQDDSRV